MTSYQRRRSLDNTLEQRVTAVETAVEHIETGMVEIKSSIITGFSDLHDRIDEQKDSSKPNIVAWAGWAAVFVIVLGMFGSGYVRDLNRIEQTTDIQDTRIRQLESNTLTTRHREQLRALEREVFPQNIRIIP